MGFSYVVQVSPKMSLLCSPSPYEVIPIIWPKSPRNNLHLPGQVSPISVLIVWPMASRNDPYCVTQVSPKWALLHGPGLRDMTSLVWPQSRRHVFHCVAQGLPK